MGHIGCWRAQLGDGEGFSGVGAHCNVVMLFAVGREFGWTAATGKRFSSLAFLYG